MKKVERESKEWNYLLLSELGSSVVRLKETSSESSESAVPVPFFVFR